MKTNYKIILYLLPIVLLFTTCRKNGSKPADQHFYYYLTKEQLSKTPYFTNPAFDTLTYISNQNDTLVFAKTKTDTLWYISSVFDPGGTADKYYHYQQLRNSYFTLKGEGKFEVKYNTKSIAVGLGYPLPNFIEIIFNQSIFNFTEASIGSMGHKFYLGDIEIGNERFEKVIYEYDKEDVDSKRVGLYSINNGFFLQIDSLNNSTFLIKI